MQFLAGFPFTLRMKSLSHITVDKEDGISMFSETLNVVIDERKRLSHVDNEALLAACREFSATEHTNRRVFKNYILSSEIFYVDASQS
jgi:hypothetical protein